jgi:hypothetical protein
MSVGGMCPELVPETGENSGWMSYGLTMRLKLRPEPATEK